MAVIAFSDERAWVKARWVVSRVLADMLVLCQDDAQLKAALDQAIALTGISVDLLEEPVASRFIEVLKEVISATLVESCSRHLTWKTGLDEKAQSLYKEAIQELSEMIRPNSCV
jgi:hypothetical protein